MDSIRSFDTETQRSVEKLDEVQVYPATEMILSRNKIGEAVRRMKEEYKKQEEAFKKRKRLAEKETSSEDDGKDRGGTSFFWNSRGK